MTIQLVNYNLVRNLVIYHLVWFSGGICITNFYHINRGYTSWKVRNEIGKNEVGKLGPKLESSGRSWKATDEIGKF